MAKKAKDKAGLKLVTEETRDVEKQFRDLYDRANKQGPAAGLAGERLRELLRANPDARLWERIAGPLSVAQTFALGQSAGITPGVQACWEERLKDIRKDLAGENPSEVERLLAQHAALCWLRLAEVEILYSSKLGNQHTLTVGAYYEKRLSMAQRRFTRACETLERVRMMRRRAAATDEARGAGARRRA